MSSDKTESSHVPVTPVDGADKPNVRLGQFTVRFGGTTGSVATAFGRPHTTATRVATGKYKIDMPATRDFNVHAQYVLPTAPAGTGLVASGPGLNLSIVEKSPYSGTFELHTTQATPTGVGAHRHVNPPNLSEVDLLFFIMPIDQF